jgi:hypothetical protein
VILISCSSSIIKINSKANQVNRKTTALAADSKQDSLQPKISERHPIKTGADNYPYTYPFTRKKIAVVTNQSGVVLIENNTENLG